MQQPALQKSIKNDQWISGDEKEVSDHEYNVVWIFKGGEDLLEQQHYREAFSRLGCFG